MSWEKTYFIFNLKLDVRLIWFAQLATGAQNAPLLLTLNCRLCTRSCGRADSSQYCIAHFTCHSAISFRSNIPQITLGDIPHSAICILPRPYPGLKGKHKTRRCRKSSTRRNKSSQVTENLTSLAVISNRRECLKINGKMANVYVKVKHSKQ